MPQSSADVGEIERRTALGESAREISLALNIATSTAHKWARAYRRRIGKPLRPTGATAAQRRKLEKLVLEGAPVTELTRQTRLKIGLVRILRRQIIDANPDMTLRCRCGEPLGHPFGCGPTVRQISPDAITEIQAMARKGASSSAIAKAVGVNQETALKHRQSVVNEMRDRGTPCQCGRSFGHLGFCRTRKMEIYPRSHRAQKLIHRRLIAGGSIADVVNDLGFPASSAKRALAMIKANPAQMAQRSASIVAASRSTRNTSQSMARRSDKLFAMIARLVPTTLPADLRDDIVSGIYVDVLSGKLPRSSVRSSVKGHINAAFRTWANRFGDRSLDEALTDEGDLTLGDLVEDGTSMALADDIRIGGAW